MSAMLLASIALLLAACDGSSPGYGGTEEPVELAAAPDSDIEFGAVSEFELIERSGATVSNATLAGAPYIASFFFAKCAGPCPALIGNVRRMQEELGADSSIRLVSITVDPERDTPEALTTYADNFTADPERWLFLTGEEEEIYPLMRKSFHLALDRMPDKDDVAAMTITHDTRVVVVDGEGQVRGYYDGMVQDEIEMALARARHLAGE